METDTYSLAALAVVVLLMLVQLLGIAMAVRAVTRTRTAQGAVAWAIALLTLPVISIPLYAVFGGRKFRGYVKARRSGTASIQRLAGNLVATAQSVRADISAHPQALQAMEQLAQMPFLRGNAARLLVDGEATFDAIFAAIDGAQRYVAIEFYIVRDDRLGRALLERLLAAMQRGVKVYFLYDALGSYELSDAYVDALRAAGAQISPFMSTRRFTHRLQMNFRNHRKIVVIDGHTAFVGGHNVGDEYVGRDPKMRPWRDTHVGVHGPAAFAVQLVFLEDWYWACGELCALSWEPVIAPDADMPALVLASGPADELDTCELTFIHAINSARERLWIASPYFVPDEAVLAALQLAAMRGVDVRIMLPRRADSLLVHLAGLAYVEDLRRSGIRLFRYRRGFLHQKVMLADELSAIGTANLDNRSFRLNFEVTMLFADAAFTAAVRAMLENDFAQCSELRETDVRAMRAPARLAARVARLFAPVL